MPNLSANRILIRGPLVALALVVCAALAAPQPALAAPPLPFETPAVYTCNPNAAGWNTLQFDLNSFGANLHRGVVFINGDNKKVDLAFDSLKNPYGWEFVLPLDNLWCKDLRVLQFRTLLKFFSCSDGVYRECYLSSY